MGIPLPSYQAIAERLRVERCPGPYETCRSIVHLEPPERTARGTIDYRTGTIHWNDRRPTRAGIYRFLTLVADLRTQVPGQFYWIHRYRTLRMIPELAKEVPVQLPRELGDRDRLALKAMLVDVPSSPLRDEAMAWAIRK